jgi:hypothetical protein
MPEPYFNEYHIQFLEFFILRDIRFLIIGGQARAVHDGSPTKDLDIWIDISADNRPAVDLALIAWAAKYPMHSTADLSQSPLPLRPGVQIKFPDDDVFYLGADGEPNEVGPADCIDILTSIGSDDFVEYYDRADWREIKGLRLPILSRQDLAAISPIKGKS